eukprot:2911534-Alexandrium_andersonii.AAC.1
MPSPASEAAWSRPQGRRVPGLPACEHEEPGALTVRWSRTLIGWNTSLVTLVSDQSELGGPKSSPRGPRSQHAQVKR